MHIRKGLGEAKLVRCSYGVIFDVIVDLRPTSPTYRKQATFELRGDEQVSLYVPAGCAHGFQALTEPADVSYRIDRPHDPAEDIAIAFDDADLGIAWPLRANALGTRPARALARRGDRGARSERGVASSEPGPAKQADRSRADQSAVRGRMCAHRCQPNAEPPGRPCTGSGGACMNRLYVFVISNEGKIAPQPGGVVDA